MKKFIILSIFVLMCLLTACQGVSNTADTAALNTASQIEAPEDTATPAPTPTPTVEIIKSSEEIISFGYYPGDDLEVDESTDAKIVSLAIHAKALPENPCGLGYFFLKSDSEKAQCLYYSFSGMDFKVIASENGENATEFTYEEGNTLSFVLYFEIQGEPSTDYELIYENGDITAQYIIGDDVIKN